MTLLGTAGGCLDVVGRLGIVDFFDVKGGRV
jgi:hypothetical protein